LFKGRQECIALFGGSFDPPHIGHQKVVEMALDVLKIEKLIVVPTFLNPFKTTAFYSTKERLSLSYEMFNPFSNAEVSDFEIQREEPTPTAITLKYFQEQYEVNYLIIGADNLASIDKWYNFKWINEQITWVIATRTGYVLDTSKLRKFIILELEIDISSTQIRKEIKDKKTK
jgi:nicotinate-nucleotide adenylyltransferase